MKKIHIIGGGLAGLSLGISLRKKSIPVELYEKGSYPRHKVCGEFISGITDDTLSRLGISEQFSDARKHKDIHWWLGDEKLLTDQLPEPAIGISRHTLDKRLADEFENRGGILHIGARIQLQQPHSEGHVWAAGKPLVKNNSKPDWIGLKIHAVDAELDGLHMHSCLSRGQGGYVGLAQVENKRVNCCGLFHVRPDTTPAQSREQWQNPAALIMSYAEACGMHQLLNIMQSWRFDTDSFTATAGFALGKQTQHHGFCLGDAAWLIPPFTGNGMSMAMESSDIASKWLEHYALGDIPWNEAEHGYQRESQKHFSRRMKLSKLMHPLLFNYPGQQILKASARSGVIPFRSLFNQLRTP